MKFDVTIFGGGTSGIAAAYTASKLGLNTLLVEKSDVLGGSITQGLVIPSMKTESKNINVDFYNDLLSYARKYNAQFTYIDENTGWFNPELLKIVFDDMLNNANCTVLFSSELNSCSYSSDNRLFNCEILHKMLSVHIETKYIIDATGNAEIFRNLNYDLQEKNSLHQAASLRFMISGIDLNAFCDYITELDKDRNVTTAVKDGGLIHLSTACTWDAARKWALTPVFERAVKDNVLKTEDCAYFQLFTVAGMPATVAVNAPRIILNESDTLNNPFTYSAALKQGRERIYRLYNFCKKYLIGFENSYISHIADMLGVRESYRVKGKYTFTKEDLISPKKFDNIAFCGDYPIDIHSNKNSADKLIKTHNIYYVPIECLISANNDRLYAAGRILSADFEAQSALRTQINCFSMGEAAAKDIYKKLRNC